MNYKNKRKRQAYEYVYLFGHSVATAQDVAEGIATFVGEISPIAKVKKQRDTKWIRWKENGVWHFSLRPTLS